MTTTVTVSENPDEPGEWWGWCNTHCEIGPFDSEAEARAAGAEHDRDDEQELEDRARSEWGYMAGRNPLGNVA